MKYEHKKINKYHFYFKASGWHISIQKIIIVIIIKDVYVFLFESAANLLCDLRQIIKYPGPQPSLIEKERLQLNFSGPKFSECMCSR